MTTIAATVMVAGTAMAQTFERVAAFNDWSVYNPNQAECWIASAPKETVNTRGGEVVDVRRGEILFFIRFEPGKGVANEIAFTGGYPFASGETVKLDVGGTRYELFVDGEWAWLGPRDASEEQIKERHATVVAALKRGTEAVLTGRSSRGTTTTDTFSLSGFTAATDDAIKRCSA